MYILLILIFYQFNKTAIDYNDLQKAKQVFNNFDKILQIPAQMNLNKKDSNLSSRQINQICKVLGENILNKSLAIKKIKDDFGDVWFDICNDMVA